MSQTNNKKKIPKPARRVPVSVAYNKRYLVWSDRSTCFLNIERHLLETKQSHTVDFFMI